MTKRQINSTDNGFIFEKKKIKLKEKKIPEVETIPFIHLV
jgi:hypothetical protein